MTTCQSTLFDRFPYRHYKGGDKRENKICIKQAKAIIGRPWMQNLSTMLQVPRALPLGSENGMKADEPAFW
jgi:hypothetical protein